MEKESATKREASKWHSFKDKFHNIKCMVYAKDFRGVTVLLASIVRSNLPFLEVEAHFLPSMGQPMRLPSPTAGIPVVENLV